jgi:hypothetical protein
LQPKRSAVSSQYKAAIDDQRIAESIDSKRGRIVNRRSLERAYPDAALGVKVAREVGSFTNRESLFDPKLDRVEKTTFRPASDFDHPFIGQEMDSTDAGGHNIVDHSWRDGRPSLGSQKARFMHFSIDQV